MSPKGRQKGVKLRKVTEVRPHDDVLECGHIKHYTGTRPSYYSPAIAAGLIKVYCNDCRLEAAAQPQPEKAEPAPAPKQKAPPRVRTRAKVPPAPAVVTLVQAIARIVHKGCEREGMTFEHEANNHEAPIVRTLAKVSPEDMAELEGLTPVLARL